MAQRTSKMRVALLPSLRERFVVFGDDMAAACEFVGVSRNTGTAWRKLDESEQGKTWNQMRADANACSEFDLLKLLQSRLRLLIENQHKRLEDRYFDQQVETAIRNIEKLEERIGGAVAVGRTLMHLTGFAAAHLADDQLELWRRIVDRFDRAVRSGELTAAML